MLNTFSLEYQQLKSRWDIKGYIGILESVFPIQNIGDYITERSVKEKCKDNPDKNYSILGVNNKDGVVDAYDELGKNIKQPYKKVETNDITYNPYRVNVGSIGIVKKGLKGKYISPAYVVFHCDESKLLTEYLYIILTAKWFNNTLRANTSGSVRQNLTFSLLSDLEVPLPDIGIQKKIVESYNEIKNNSLKLQKDNLVLNNELDKFLMNKLGIQIEKKHKNKFFVVGYENFERWDINFNVSNSVILSDKYELLTIKDIISGNPSYGSNKPSRNGNIDADYRYIRITDIDDDGMLKPDTWVTIEKFEEKYILNENDFLIARTGGTIGKTFLYKNDYGKSVFAGYLIKFPLDSNKIVPELLYEITKTTYYKNWLRSLERFSGQPNINSKEFLSFAFPVPKEIEEQKSILDSLSEIKRKLIKNNKTIDLLNNELDNKIEKMILGGKYL